MAGQRVFTNSFDPNIIEYYKTENSEVTYFAEIRENRENLQNCRLSLFYCIGNIVFLYFQHFRICGTLWHILLRLTAFSRQSLFAVRFANLSAELAERKDTACCAYFCDCIALCLYPYPV